MLTYDENGLPVRPTYFVIYDRETTMYLVTQARTRRSKTHEYHTSERAAKAALTRAANAGHLPAGKEKADFAIAERGEFRANIEKQVTRTNMMSGKPFSEGINTPSYLSPASEAYWSM